MKTLYIVVAFLVFSVTALPALAQTPKQQQDEQAAALREKLSPSIEAMLAQQCGEDCPSFRLDPIFKKAATDSLDDLGFSKPSEPTAAPELQAASLSVLVQDKVTPGARESLRKILANRLSNDAGVPVSVKMMPLNAYAPLLEKRLHPAEALPMAGDARFALWMGFVKTSIWPACLLLLAGLAFFGLLRVLRHRKEMLRESLAGAAESVAPEALPAPTPESVVASRWLADRAEDIRWLIEDAALHADTSALRKALSLFSAQGLTGAVRFSRETLTVLAALEATAEKPDARAALAWLEPALDRAHWRRLEEQADAVAKVRRAPAAKLRSVFARLSSPAIQAALLSAIDEQRWPELLVQLKAEQRIQVGLALADYAAAKASDRSAVDARLAGELGEWFGAGHEAPNVALESYALYLSETDGQKLWQELSNRRLAGEPGFKPSSVDSLLGGLESSAAAEVCSRLDFGTLSVVLSQVSGETQARVYQGLPKGLQSRLASGTESGRKASSEAEQMKARARLMDAVRKFHAESVV